jgi:hypothetical protein
MTQTDVPTLAQYAASYCKQFGLHLVQLPPRSKRPSTDDWGNNLLSDPAQARDFFERHPDANVGVALGPSRLCSLDVDDLDATRVIFEEFGWDLDALVREHPTVQGQAPGFRVMFRVPDGVALPYHSLTWPSQADPDGTIHRGMIARAVLVERAGNRAEAETIKAAAKAFARFTVFEIRAAVEQQRQDVLPPSIHPDTGRPYVWLTRPAAATGFPTPPEYLLQIWANWDALKPQFQAACPWAPKPELPKRRAPAQVGPGGSVIEAYDRAHSITEALSRYGYKQQGKRWLSPHSSTKLPGVVVFERDNKAFIHHASDPLCSNETGQPVAPFDLFCRLEHGGDVKKAVRAAGDQLGMAMPRRQATGAAPQTAGAPAPSTGAAPEVDPETGEILGMPPEPANDNEPAIDTFGEPLDVFGVRPPPELPLDVLPRALVAYVRDQAELTGCDPAIIGLSALVAAAACINDGVRLQPKRYDPTWTESARLWVAIVGDPSTKKSPAISKAVRHVKRIDHRMAEDNASAMSDYRWQHDQWKEAKKADKTNPPPEPKQPAIKRLVVEDITVEALTEVLKDNPRGVLTLKDELTGWFASMDAYKGAAKGASMDRAHWLEAYNGGRRSIDRVTRGSVIVPNWSTCIIGGVQPDMMRRVASSMGNDGLLQRFMVLCARPAVVDVDRAPDMQAMARFGELFDYLADLQESPTPVVLSEAAHLSRERVARYAKRMIDAFDNPHIQAWLGKWDGLYARLLLLYHCIECHDLRQHPVNVEVDGETADQVERLLCGVLLHHAIHFYAEIVDANERQEHVRQLARLILAKGFERITKRDITLLWKASRRLEWWELRQVIDALCTMDWLRADEAALDTDGKPRAWVVNASVHAMFAAAAEREQQRRRAATETLREIRHAYDTGT